MKTRTKSRTFQHLMEEESEQIFKAAIPSEWVIRKYQPDYGIDYSIEIFGNRNADGTVETLGEHLFVQLKSVRKAKIQRVMIYSGLNPFQKINVSDVSMAAIEIEAISFGIDTKLLQTVQRMTSAVPVILVLVSLDDKQIYFICLNDYIDKVMLRSDKDYAKKSSKKIYIPKQNSLPHSDCGFKQLEFYSKRAKLYSLFQLSRYYDKELRWKQYSNNELAISFIKSLLNLDVWYRDLVWKGPWMQKERLHQLQNILESTHPEANPELICALPFAASFDVEKRKALIPMLTEQTFNLLVTLPGIFEETIREYMLPTHIDAFTSKL